MIGVLVAVALLSPQAGADPVGGGRAAEDPVDGRPVVVEVRPDTVRVGEHVTLSVTVPVPPGHTVFFPDTLPRIGDVETRRPARWEVVGTRGDTTSVAVAWALAVYRPGPAPLPAVPLIVRERAPAGEVGATPLPGGGFVGSWSALPRVPDFTYVRSVVPAGQVHVAPTLLEFDLMEGAAPRPPRDVAGASWNAWLVGMGLLLLAGLAGCGWIAFRWTTAGREGPVAAPGPPADDGEPAWARALRELDRVRAQGLHRAGVVDEFYARSTDAVRRYVESHDPRWGPDLTTSELLQRAGARLPAERVDALSPVMVEAEGVKFAGHRPTVRAAERDWERLRDWVEATGRGGSVENGRGRRNGEPGRTGGPPRSGEDG